LFRSDADPAWAVEMLYSPIYRRLIFGEPLDAEFIRLLSKSVDLLSTEARAKIPGSKPKR
jgi:hypothetical protein